MEFLPASALPKPARNDKLEEACLWPECAEMNSWEFAHKCFAAWTAILPTIRADTRAALEAFSVKTGEAIPMREVVPADADASEWVVYDRCATGEDNICAHPVREQHPCWYTQLDNTVCCT